MSVDVQPYSEYKPGAKVSGTHPKDIIDKAIAMPDGLQSDDGRAFHIRRWTVDVPVPGTVKVTGTFLVSLPKED
jgi:hypothetical protein